MSKRLKNLIIQEYQDAYKGVENACLISLVGLGGVATNQFRNQLRKRNFRIQVLRNRLAGRAFEGTALEPLTKGMQNSCAIVHGGDSAVDVAKFLVEAAEEFTAIELLTGILEGDDELILVTELAKYKSKDELVSEIAMLILSPSGNIAGALAGAGGKIAGCLKTIAEKE